MAPAACERSFMPSSCIGFSHSETQSVGFPRDTRGSTWADHPRRIVLADLPPNEKERFFEFLVANRVDFVADQDCQQYTATIRVLNPPADVARDREPRGSTRVRTPPCSPRKGKAPLPRSVGSKQVMRRKSSTLGLLPSSWVALGTEKTRDLSLKYHAFLKLAPPLVLTPKHMNQGQLMRIADETYTKAMTVPERAQPTSQFGKPAEEYPLPRTFRDCLLETVSGSFGLPQLVGQTCWGIVGSVEALRGESDALEIFGRFLDDTYDNIDFGFFLLIRSSVLRVRDGNDSKTRAQAGGKRAAKAASGAAGNGSGSAEKGSLRLTVRQCCAVLWSAMGKRREELQTAIATHLDEALAEHPGEDTLEADFLLCVALEEFHFARELPEPELPAPAIPMLKDDRLADQVVDAMILTLERRGIDLRDLFLDLDVDEETPLTPEQLRHLLDEGGLTFSDTEYAALLSRVDAEGHGQVAPVQVTKYLRKLEKRRVRQVLMEAPMHSAPEGAENHATLPRDLLPPDVVQQAEDLAKSLRSSLLQQGKAEVDGESTFEWALQAVMRGREVAEADGSPSLVDSLACNAASRDMPLAEMEQAWNTWLRDNKSPHKRVTLLRTAWTPQKEEEGTEHALPAGDKRHRSSLIQMPPEVFEQNLEANVKSLLEYATMDLAARACKATYQPDKVRKMLASFLAPIVDAMMGALVVDDFDQWLQLLRVEAAETGKNRPYFEMVRRAFIEALHSEIDGQKVKSICDAVVATPELEEIAFQEAEHITRSGNYAALSPTPGTSTQRLPATSVMDNRARSWDPPLGNAASAAPLESVGSPGVEPEETASRSTASSLSLAPVGAEPHAGTSAGIDDHPDIEESF